MKRNNLKRSAILGVLMSFVILGSAWAAGIKEDVNTTGPQSAVAMEITATRIGNTQTDTASQKIASNEITLDLNSTYASYGHSLFQMKNMWISVKQSVSVLT